MQAKKLGKITKKNTGIYQSGGLLGDFFSKAGSIPGMDPSSSSKLFGQAGGEYKDLFGGIKSSGTFATREDLPEWGDQAAEQFRQKVISNMKLKKVGDNYRAPDGKEITYDELTDLAGKLYDQTKAENKSFNEGAPLATQVSGLLELGRKEQEELRNKKETIQDYPVTRSSFAPSGFAEQGGKIEAYSNLLSLFRDGGNPQHGGRVSVDQQMMGYMDNSPYRNMPSQEFYTDTLTMNGVSTPIMAVPNVGSPVMMAPNSGNYYFPGASQITEVPMAKDGGKSKKPKPASQQFREYNDSLPVQALKLADPTGVSAYPDVYFAGKDFVADPSWEGAANVGLNVLGALPGVGYLGRGAKLAKVINNSANTAKAINISRTAKSSLDSKYEDNPYAEIAQYQTNQIDSSRPVVTLPIKSRMMQEGGGLLSIIKAQNGSTASQKELAQIRQQEAIDYYNRWRDSQMGSSMLRGSTESDDDYNKYYKGREESLKNLPNVKFIEEQAYHPNKLPKSGFYQHHSGSPNLVKSWGVSLYPYGVESPTTIVHETGHAEDQSGKFIPENDKKLINSFKPKSFEQSPLGSSESAKNMSKKEKQSEWKYMQTYGDPKEVRQLLNQIRYSETVDPNSLYDPYTQKVTPEIFDAMKNKVYENESKNPLDILKKNFTDDQIIDLLNTISYKDDNKNSDIQLVQQGGMIFQMNRFPMAFNGGMYMNGVPQAKAGNFFKKLGNVVSDYGRGMADSFGNMTGLYDIGNEGYKTKFGRKIAGGVDKFSRTIGKIGDVAVSALLPGVGSAIVGAKNAIGQTINPQGLGAAQEQRNADRANMLSSLDPTGRTKGGAGLSSLLGGVGGGGGLGALGGLLGGAGGGGGLGALGGLLGGAGGGGGLGALGGLLGMGEDGGKMSYNNLNSLFQDGGDVEEGQQEVDNQFLSLPEEQQVEVYKSLIDFILENGIDELEEKYPEEYEFFEIYSDFLEESGNEDDEDEGGFRPEQMANGGIPQRYRNQGFNKVGQKRQSTRPGKKWMVLAKKGDKYKIVHGGAKGMSDFTKHKNLKRRNRFWDRMGGTDSAKAKDPFSPLYWHKRFGTW